MTTADATTELHYFLWMIAVVLVTGIMLGALTRDGRSVTLAALQATAFTAVGMLATVRPTDPADGQTALGIPLMWVPFFLASWVGLVIGAKIVRRQLNEHQR
jgi:urea transporter